MKARPCQNTSGERIGYMIFCPGCRCGHLVHVDPYKNEETGSSWGFNGDVEKPTFTPSILVTGVVSDTDPTLRICHSFVRDGVMQFLMDSTHDKRGCLVPLEDI